MTRSWVLIGFSISVLALLLAGCRMPGGTSPPTRYWVLQPVAGEPAGGPTKRFVGIGPFVFPGYLERSEIVTRTGENELEVAPFDRWGGGLDYGFQQVLARNVEIMAPGTRTTVFPWSGPLSGNFQVAGIVSRFEAVKGQSAILEVSWVISLIGENRRVADASGRWEEKVDGESMAAQVAALNGVLAQFSRELADQLSAIISEDEEEKEDEEVEVN